jgi:hypothetical protein
VATGFMCRTTAIMRNLLGFCQDYVNSKNSRNDYYEKGYPERDTFICYVVASDLIYFSNWLRRFINDSAESSD